MKITKKYLETEYHKNLKPMTQIAREIGKGKNFVRKYMIKFGIPRRTLQDASQSPGRYERIWDGNNEFGNKVSSGVYFYRMQSNNFSQVRKMILLK